MAGKDDDPYERANVSLADLLNKDYKDSATRGVVRARLLEDEIKRRFQQGDDAHKLSLLEKVFEVLRPSGEEERKNPAEYLRLLKKFIEHLDQKS